MCKRFDQMVNYVGQASSKSVKQRHESIFIATPLASNRTKTGSVVLELALEKCNTCSFHPSTFTPLVFSCGLASRGQLASSY
ncbi:hypothetical protein K0M31_009240 [Melipona bicolor]|uniref:Uncharacterized protein n=1 Tax=Melipona bicolor TaxID=60889 RepID=A0AA40KJK4_9HYME|nr:hypothetical protein K0M31_009240 [Melipona bicolor]